METKSNFRQRLGLSRKQNLPCNQDRAQEDVVSFTLQVMTVSMSFLQFNFCVLFWAQCYLHSAGTICCPLSFALLVSTICNLAAQREYIWREIVAVPGKPTLFVLIHIIYVINCKLLINYLIN